MQTHMSTRSPNRDCSMLLLVAAALLQSTSLTAGLSLQQQPVLEEQPEMLMPKKPRVAYVTMALSLQKQFDFEQKQMIYQVYALASALRQHSQYPLVVLTNLSTVPDPDCFTTGLEALGATVRQVQPVHIPPHIKAKLTFEWQIAWLKLQVFNMTDFHRLIWLDNDSVVTESLDFLFNRPGMWSQGDDWNCTGNATSVNSGLMLLRPQKHVFWGMLRYAESLKSVEGGDQELIQRYFNEVQHQQIYLLGEDMAHFGRCLQDVDDQAVVPRFVHKPGSLLSCLRALGLLRTKHSFAVPMLHGCRTEGLGNVWRRSLCSSGLQKDKAVDAFCLDSWWEYAALGSL
mmetsp:Transcript_18389/g.42940  ORF Transcript_18389/g.42940 Transcript_18389/m.42940 type:complete len:343 (+) Transcript_18389:1-1029(+)